MECLYSRWNIPQLWQESLGGLPQSKARPYRESVSSLTSYHGIFCDFQCNSLRPNLNILSRATLARSSSPALHSLMQTSDFNSSLNEWPRCSQVWTCFPVWPILFLHQWVGMTYRRYWPSRPPLQPKSPPTIFRLHLGLRCHRNRQSNATTPDHPLFCPHVASRTLSLVTGGTSCIRAFSRAYIMDRECTLSRRLTLP